MSISSVGMKVLACHKELHRLCDRLSRIAIAIYDPETDTLKTFVDSTDIGSPLRYYEAHLAQVPSLQVMAESGCPRVIDDLWALNGSKSPHTRRLLAAGYRSSFTIPLRYRERFLGFVFFDSKERAYFSLRRQDHLVAYARMLATILGTQLIQIESASGAIRRQFSQRAEMRDNCHLMRVAQYSRFIARHLAEGFGLSDEYVEYLYQFAPLYDLGMIAIPENLLLKPCQLDSDEFRIVQSHVAKGREIVQVMIRRFDLAELYFLPILYNLIGAHHERYDGSGYPQGLAAGDIPLEARIVAVADVLDALTHCRPYRKAGSFDQALGYLAEERGTLFDPDCVDAVLMHAGLFRQVCDNYQEGTC